MADGRPTKCVSCYSEGERQIVLRSLKMGREAFDMADAREGEVLAAILDAVLSAATEGDCGHLEEYQTEDGCLRCFDEAHRQDFRQLASDTAGAFGGRA